MSISAFTGFDSQFCGKYFTLSDGSKGIPNWYYYWNQTSASSGSHQYDSATGNYGYYNPGDSHFYIGPPASGINNTTGHDGIDCFAETCIHENIHLTDWCNFWPNGYNATQDTDGDQIPDSLELGMGFDPTKFDTDTNDQWPYDFAAYSEARSYPAEKTWSKGNADSEDWSAPGHQY